jgi:hypothetical protein
MAVLAAAERQGISQPCQWRPPRTRPPAADQVMTLLLLQLVLGQLCGAEKSPQQLAHTPAHQPPPARRPAPGFLNCSNISKGLRRCLSVPPAHHTHHTASLMPCAHCKPVRQNGWPRQPFPVMKQKKARAVELWADMDWVMDGVCNGTIGMEYFMMLSELWGELVQLEEKTGLCLCRVCAPEPYRL